MAKDNENKKEEITKLYYEDNLTQKEIAKKLGVTQGYVSQIIKEGARYTIHKKEKHQKSLEKKAIYNKEYYKTYERPKKDDDSYRQLQAQLDKDSVELSSAGGYISDFDFAKWNPNAYEVDKNGNLKLVKGLKTSIDVPKTVNRKRKIPTQKFKKKYCHSR